MWILVFIPIKFGLHSWCIQKLRLKIDSGTNTDLHMSWTELGWPKLQLSLADMKFGPFNYHFCRANILLKNTLYFLFLVESVTEGQEMEQSSNVQQEEEEVEVEVFVPPEELGVPNDMEVVSYQLTLYWLHLISWINAVRTAS